MEDGFPERGIEPGERVLDLIRSQRCDVPVLLMSGYAEAEAMRR